MNRRERRRAVAIGRKDVARGRCRWQDLILPLCDEMYSKPLTEAERALAAEVLAWWQEFPPTWYHGGLPGRAVGDALLPAGETGADPRGEGEGFLWRREFVYITPEADLAATYATLSGGCIYRVAPGGALGVDPTALRRARMWCQIRRRRFHPNLILEFTCPRAEVLGVLT